MKKSAPARETSSSAQRRIWRLAAVISLLAAIVVLVVLGALRWYGYVTDDDYSWPFIFGNAMLVALMVPVLFWIAERPWMNRIYQLIGGLLLFGVIPTLLIWWIIQWLTGIPLF